MGGDGCSALCAVEPGHYFEVEPNDDGTPSTGGGSDGNDFTGALPNANGLFDTNVVIHARLSPDGDEDLFALRNDTTQVTTWSLSVNITEPGQTCAGHDTYLNVRDSAGAVLARFDDSAPGNFCPVGTITVPPLTVVYLQVLQFSDAAAVPRYTLTLTRTALCKIPVAI